MDILSIELPTPLDNRRSLTTMEQPSGPAAEGKCFPGIVPRELFPTPQRENAYLLWLRMLLPPKTYYLVRVARFICHFQSRVHGVDNEANKGYL